MLMDKVRSRFNEFIRHGLAGPQPNHEEELFNLRSRLERAERRSSQYFDLIVRIEKQRDERWQMFLDHSAAHQKAESYLQDHIILTRQFLVRALTELNKYREKDGEKPIVHHTQLLDAPIGTAEEFAAYIKSLRDSVSPAINGIEERDRITAETA